MHQHVPDYNASQCLDLADYQIDFQFWLHLDAVPAPLTFLTRQECGLYLDIFLSMRDMIVIVGSSLACPA